MDIIQICRYARQYSQEYVASAIRECQNIDIQNNSGWTALMCAVERADTTSTPETVKMLIEAGANLDIQEQYGDTALTLASRSSSSVIHLLINAGAKLDFQNMHGWTALIWSIICLDFPTLDILIRAGAKLDIKDKKGMTALMHATEHTTSEPQEIGRILYAKACNMLIQAGAV